MKRTIFPYDFSPYYPVGIQPCSMYVDVANRIYVSNFIMNLISALGAYCFFDNKPKALQGYCIEETKQLSLF